MARAGLALLVRHLTGHLTGHFTQQAVEQFHSLPSEERQQAQRALLQSVMREQRAQNFLFVAIQHASAKILGAPGLAAQLLELVEDFSCDGIERGGQRFVHLAKRGTITPQNSLQALLITREFCRKAARQGIQFHLAANCLASVQRITKIERVFLQRARHRRLDQRETGARQNRGHTSEDAAIYDLRLRHVGDFRGSADVSGGGQKRILQNGTQQNAGRQFLRGTVNLGEQFGGGELRIASNETTVSPPKRLAFALHVEEKECRLLRDFHLCVEAELVESFIARRQVGDERLRFFHRFAVHGS